MTWFKIDDKFRDHRKVRKLGRSQLPAVGLWTMCGDWSADNLTDGFVPLPVVRQLDAKLRYARLLVEVGLWHETVHDGEPGYEFHQWTEHQPSRQEVQDKRKKRQEAGRRGGIKSGETRRSKPEANASPLLEPRPDPTRNTTPSDYRASPTAPPGPGITGSYSTAAYRLVDTTIGRNLGSTIRTALAIETATLLPELGHDTVQAALQRWNTRTGIGPRTLPHLAADIIKETAGTGATLRAGAPRAKPSTTDQRLAEIQALKDTPGPLRLIEGEAS